VFRAEITGSRAREPCAAVSNIIRKVADAPGVNDRVIAYVSEDAHFALSVHSAKIVLLHSAVGDCWLKRFRAYIFPTVLNFPIDFYAHVR